MKDQPPAFDEHAYDNIGAPKFVPIRERVIVILTPVFRKGDRVRLTAEGRAANFFTRSDKGTVSSRGITPRGRLRVVVDGTKTPASYHPSFWELDA